MGNGNGRWQQFLIGVLGTAIGVALTFSLNGLRESKKKQQAQRLTAIMVIHDIDNTIDILKSWKQQEASKDTLLHYAMDNRDHLDKVPSDTLSNIILNLVSQNRSFRFDTSKEEIFNSDLDTWQNLGSVQFLDNVQSFFYDRQTLQQINEDPEWKEPIPYDDYLQLVMDIDPNLIDFELDASKLVAAEGMQDSLDAWKEKYLEQGRQSLKDNSDDYYRDAYKVRMDSSKDKMQWTAPEGYSRYVKRKE